MLKSKILNKPLRYKGLVIPKNAVCVINDGIYYFAWNLPCEFPTSGILQAVYLIPERGEIGSVYLKNEPEKAALITAYKRAGYPYSPMPYNENYAALMRHSRKNKRQNGGRLCNSEGGVLRYKQVTEDAYWANLYDNKSGNASIIASSIRV